MRFLGIRKVVSSLLGGVILLSAGTALWRWQSDYVDGLLTEGVAQTAIVTGGGDGWGRGSWDWIGVDYQFQGLEHERRLRSKFASYTDHQIGEAVTVYVDPDDPERVATADGFSSLGHWLKLPWGFWTFGGVLVLYAVAVSLRWRRVPAPLRRLDPVPSLSVVALKGWPDVWREPLADLHARCVMAARGRVWQGPRVCVLFKAVEASMSRAEVGIHGYVPRLQVIKIKVSLSQHLDGDIHVALREGLVEAVDLAEQYARDNPLADNLELIRYAARATIDHDGG